MNYLIYIIIVILIVFIVYTLYENANPIKEKYSIKKSLPNAIKELKILHISDLHNYNFGYKQEKIIKLLDEDYDLIFITGDLIDRRYPNIEIAMDLVSSLKGEVFFSKGNHEKGSSHYIDLEKKLIESGVRILDNKNYNYRDINIMGIDDPSDYITLEKKVKKDEENILKNNLKSLLEESNSPFNFLLSHRPEFFEVYVENNIDLVFSGHTHGGQVRIFNRGLLSPGQGIFAKYSGGIFKKNNTIMFNSRGLGNNFPFVKRVFNRPHITEIRLINKNYN